MRPLVDELRSRLQVLDDRGLLRSLQAARGLDFASNDYLGLARDPRLRELLCQRLDAAPGVGTAASRLLRGHTPEHRRLEARLAALKGQEAALLYPSGWQANVGLLTAVVAPGDRVLSDELNHASLIDGLRLARCAKTIYPHLDVAAVRRELERPWPGRTFLLTESLYSMDGDVAPLVSYAELCAEHGAELVVDDAHATGLWGAERGGGLLEALAVEERVFAVTATGGKALGIAGGFVAGPRALVDYLVNASRSFVFSTAVPTALVLALDAALDLLAEQPERRQRLHALAERLRARLRAGGLDVGASQGPIVPLIVGGNRDALELAERLQAAGYDVRAVRPPTVAPGTARLRISVHADHRQEHIDALADHLLKHWPPASPRTAPKSAVVGAAPAGDAP